MGQLRVRMEGLECRHRLVDPVVHDDGVAFDMAETFGPGLQVDVEILAGIPLDHRPGHHVGLAVLALEDEFVFGGRRLVSIGHDPLGDEQGGAGADFRFIDPVSLVHAPQLAEFHFGVGARFKIDLGGRVEDPLPLPLAGGHVLFHVFDRGVFSHPELVDSLVPLGFRGPAVNAAPGHDGHIGILADVEGVEDHVVEPGLAQDDRDVDRFVDRSRLYPDHDAVARFVGFDLDIGGHLPAQEFAVLPDVVGALGDAFQIRDLFQQFLIDSI